MSDEKNEIHNEELTSDVKAFCELVARIIMRCLRERDSRVLQVLALSFTTDE